MDHQPILKKPTSHNNRVLDAIYALIKWPESKPGLLFDGHGHINHVNTVY
jgi:hypothetical protein